ncbi:unnamed protein product, partial [Chondrus crispus]
YRAAAASPKKRPRAKPDGTNPRGKRNHFFSHRVPATSITVDSFYAAKDDPAKSVYFLTHFHSDHYGGLRKSTLPEGARVYCSSVTASLVHSQLRVRKESIVVLPIAEVVSEGKLDYLHLDTTYCNPQYVFPYQANVLQQVVHAAKEENRRTKGQCLFFFGTYSIGKEKVFFAVAEALNLKIYAGKRKRGILEQCAFGAKLTGRLVNSAGEARVQVVSMRALSADGLREYAVRNSLNTSFIGRGLAIVFRPTGWTFRGDASKPRQLVAFVKWCKPARVVPTVNARSKEDADKLRALLGHTDTPLRRISSLPLPS